MPPRHSFPFPSLPFLFYPLALALAAAAQSTTTFDDTHSSFSWYGEWSANSGDCPWCATKLDQSRVNGGTWHDGNYMNGKAARTGGAFSFTGTGVAIYGIDQPAGAALAFTLDGAPAGTYYYAGTDNNKVYNSRFFAKDGLGNGPHKVEFVLQYDSRTPSGQNLVVALLDYAVVTSAPAASGGGGGAGVGGGSGGNSENGGGTGGGSSGSGNAGGSAGGNGNGSTGGSSGGNGSVNGNTNPGPNSVPNSSVPISSSAGPGPASASASSALKAGAAGNNSSASSATGSLKPIGAIQTSSGSAISAGTTSPPAIVSVAGSKHSSVGVAIGAALGVLALLVLLLIAFCIWRRRRTRPATLQAYPADVGAATEMGNSRPSGGHGVLAAELPSGGPYTHSRPAAPVSEKTDPFWTAAAAIAIPTPTTAHQHNSNVSESTSPSSAYPRDRSESPVRFNTGSASASRHGHGRSIDELASPLSRSPSTIVSVTSRGRSTRTTSTMRERERMLEARVAELEARIGTLGGMREGEGAQRESDVPPPYARGSREIRGAEGTM